MDLSVVKDTLLVASASVGIAFQIQTLRGKAQEGRTQIKVVHSGGVRFGPFGPSPMLCMMEAQNHGARSIVLSGYGYELPDNRRLVFPDELGANSFPAKLEPGDSVQVGLTYDDLIGSLAHEGYRKGVELVPFFRDKIDRIFRGKPFTVT